MKTFSWLETEKCLPQLNTERSEKKPEQTLSNLEVERNSTISKEFLTHKKVEKGASCCYRAKILFTIKMFKISCEGEHEKIMSALNFSLTFPNFSRFTNVDFDSKVLRLS